MSSIDGKDPKTRKDVPICTGVLDYFPDALIEVARLSKIGNDQHNPGQPLHWSKGKSNDHPDCLIRHQLDRGKFDTDGVRHSAKVAWRALAQLQIEIESELEAAAAAGCAFKVGDSVIHREDDTMGVIESIYVSDGVLGAAARWPVDTGHAVVWYPLADLELVVQ